MTRITKRSITSVAFLTAVQEERGPRKNKRLEYGLPASSTASSVPVGLLGLPPLPSALARMQYSWPSTYDALGFPGHSGKGKLTAALNVYWISILYLFDLGDCRCGYHFVYEIKNLKKTLKSRK